jgi:aminomethyltransferase
MTEQRQSVLASRHRALGSELSDWNGMDVAWEYAQDINNEHVAVRTAAGLFDVSGLKKIHLTGPDALAVANHLVTRDLTKIYPGKSVYTMILNDDGRITDDCIMFNIRPNDILMVHGSGTGLARLQESAAGKRISVEFDDDLHDISLQGPMAVSFLNEYTPFDLASLKYFHHVSTTLFDRHCMISRTGYSGERGYEIFCKADDAGPIWDEIVERGAAQGIIPCSFNCIDMIRVEAALLFYPYDMTEENTPWEMGLGFTVSKNKEAYYRGKEGLMAAQGDEKVKTYGLVADCEKAVDLDAEIFVDGDKVGKVTQPMFSTITNQSLAMAQLRPDLAVPGVTVEIKGETISCTATTHPLPFYDPEKVKRTAL